MQRLLDACSSAYESVCAEYVLGVSPRCEGPEWLPGVGRPCQRARPQQGAPVWTHLRRKPSLGWRLHGRKTCGVRASRVCPGCMPRAHARKAGRCLPKLGHSGRDRPNQGQFRPKSGKSAPKRPNLARMEHKITPILAQNRCHQTLPDVDQLRQKEHRNRPILARNKPTSTRSRTNLRRDRPKLEQHRHTSARIDQTCPEFGETMSNLPRHRQHWPEFDQTCSEIDRGRRAEPRNRPALVGNRPASTRNRTSGPEAAHLPNVGRLRLNSGRDLPNSTRAGPISATFDRKWPDIGQVGSEFTNFCPNSATFA